MTQTPLDSTPASVRAELADGKEVTLHSSRTFGRTVRDPAEDSFKERADEYAANTWVVYRRLRSDWSMVKVSDKMPDAVEIYDLGPGSYKACPYDNEGKLREDLEITFQVDDPTNTVPAPTMSANPMGGLAPGMNAPGGGMYEAMMAAQMSERQNRATEEAETRRRRREEEDEDRRRRREEDDDRRAESRAAAAEKREQDKADREDARERRQEERDRRRDEREARQSERAAARQERDAMLRMVSTAVQSVVPLLQGILPQLLKSGGGEDVAALRAEIASLRNKPSDTWEDALRKYAIIDKFRDPNGDRDRDDPPPPDPLEWARAFGEVAPAIAAIFAARGGGGGGEDPMALLSQTMGNPAALAELIEQNPDAVAGALGHIQSTNPELAGAIVGRAAELQGGGSEPSGEGFDVDAPEQDSYPAAVQDPSAA